MSETPPVPPTQGGPEGSPQPYFRPSGGELTDVSRLRALWEGYNALTLAFVVNIVMALGIGAYWRTGGSQTVALVGYGVMFLVVVALTLSPNKKIAYGKGWDPNMAILASILIGLNSALCCGAIGFAIMQSLAGKEIRRYGLTRFNKKLIEARIQELENMPTQANFMP